MKTEVTSGTTVRPSRGRSRRGVWVGRVVTGSVLLVATLTALGAVGTAIMTVTGRYLFAIGATDPRRSLTELPQMFRADLREGATGTLADLDLGMRVLGAVPSAIHAATVVLAAWLLLRVLRGVSGGTPFSGQVLNSWSRLSVVLLAGGVLQAVVDTAAVVYLSRRVGLLYGTATFDESRAFLGGDYEGINIGVPDWPIPILVAGLVALALTTAFRAGARLERDVDGVV